MKKYSMVFKLSLMSLLAFCAVESSAVSIALAPFNATSSGLDVSMDVTSDGSNAFFTFTNNSTGDAAGSSVARIYFESGLSSLGLSNGVVGAQSGTDFSTSYPGPANPPSGNNMPNSSWAGTLLAFGAGSPPPVNGINVGDSITLSFNYAGSESALLTALTDLNGQARVAVHVLDCVNGNSCVASVTAVPVPAALPLLLSALIGLRLFKRK